MVLSAIQWRALERSVIGLYYTNMLGDEVHK